MAGSSELFPSNSEAFRTTSTSWRALARTWSGTGWRRRGRSAVECGTARASLTREVKGRTNCVDSSASRATRSRQ